MYALAAQYMGMRFVYLEAGSGATEPVTPEMVNLVRKSFSGVLIVGGGIRTPRTAKLLSQAGADILVVGTRIEEDPSSKSLKNIINSISTRS
jgi:phosphoglycerol geranylgeranyltransferase